MKSQLTRKCILGSVAFFSQTTLGISLEATQYENNTYNPCVNAWERAENMAIENFTVLNLGPSDSLGSSAMECARRIVSVNADVVCISEVYDLAPFYEALQNSYAHFLYLDSTAPALGATEQRLMGSVLIASKYPLEEAQFSKVHRNSSNSSEGLVDFVIKNGNGPIGHIYTANLRSDQPIEIQASAFFTIIEKMQRDFLRTEGATPFFLCGDFSALQACEESKTLIDTYFVADNIHGNNSQALLLQTSTVLPNETERILLTTKVPMDGIRSALKAVITKRGHEHVLTGRGKGEAEASVKADTEGNASAGGSVGYTYESEGGNKYSVEVSGSVQRDSEGNYSGGGQVDVGIQYDR